MGRDMRDGVTDKDREWGGRGGGGGREAED